MLATVKCDGAMHGLAGKEILVTPDKNFVPREAKFWGRPKYFCSHSFGPTGIYKHSKGDIKIFTHYIEI